MKRQMKRDRIDRINIIDRIDRINIIDRIDRIDKIDYQKQNRLD